MGTSIRQTETDRNRHVQNWPLCGGSCREHIIGGEKELEIERERETESKTERHTYGEKDRDKTQEKERERGREEKTEKYRAHLVDATKKSPRSSKTVMKRTASLRFAALAPQ